MDKEFLTKQGQMKNAISEVEILRTLDHPYIASLYDAF
jgi:hypothetical protein